MISRSVAFRMAGNERVGGVSARTASNALEPDTRMTETPVFVRDPDSDNSYVENTRA